MFREKMTRRGLLRLGAGAGFAAATGSTLAGCGSEESEESAAEQTVVTAVRGDDLDTMAREALESVGGAKAIVQPGESVFIKPNMVTVGWASIGRDPFGTGECTKPEILVAVAEECLRAGASRVTIGDASQMSTFSWEYATTLDGSTNLHEEVKRLNSQYDGKLALACLDTESPSWVEVPSRTSLGTIGVSSLVAEADRVISIPALKTHQWAQLTLSMKNFVGTTPLARYNAKTDGTLPRVGLHLAGIEQVFLDIVAGVKPDLAIIDCSLCVEGDGPTAGAEKGHTVDMKERNGSWLLLTSTDLAAADATAARIMSHDVSTIRQLTMAQEQGLGETREEAIHIDGAKLEDLIVDWKAATPEDIGGLSSYHMAPARHRGVA
jgi:uncharacterized protein (DUF362 family)